MYLTINRIAPDYEGLELGIGESLLVKAIAESSGRSVQQVKNELEKTGDLGDIAQVHPPTPIPTRVRQTVKEGGQSLIIEIEGGATDDV